MVVFPGFQAISRGHLLHCHPSQGSKQSLVVIFCIAIVILLSAVAIGAECVDILVQNRKDFSELWTVKGLCT